MQLYRHKWCWTLRSLKFSSCPGKHEKISRNLFWLIVNWSYIRYQKIGRYQKVVYSPFCMNICQWESCVRSGCRIYSQLIKNNVSMIQSIVCNCFNSTERSFCINVTMDETLIHHFTLGSNRQSVEWTAAGENRPKWPKMQTSTGKVLAFVFWDAQGILFINYLEKRITMNSEYNVLLVHLKEEIAKKTATNEEKSALSSRQCTVTSWSQWWQKYMNCSSNCFCTHPIFQIWLPATTRCLLTSKEFSRKRDLAPVNKWYWKLRHILRPKTNCSTKKALNC